MKRRTMSAVTLVVTITLLISTVFIFGCQAPATTAPATTGGPAAPQTLKIGMVNWLGFLPGISSQKSVSAMVEDINKKGGLAVGPNKYTIQLIQYDSNNVQTTGVSATNRLIFEDKVKYIISDSFVDAVIPICEENKVLLSGSSVTPPLFNPNLKYAFNTSGTTAQSIILDGWWIKKFPEKKYIILTINDVQIGRAVGENSANQLRSFGLKAEVIYYPVGQQDFSAVATQVKTKNPDAVMPFELPVMKAIAESGWKGQFFAAFKIPAAQVIAQVGPQIAEGFLAGAYPTDFDPPSNKAGVDFKAAYTAKHGQWDSPEMTGAGMFTAITAAMQKAGSIDVDQVAAALGGGLIWEGPQGEVAMFSRTGTGRTNDSVYAGTFKEIKGGKAVLLDKMTIQDSLATALDYYKKQAASAPPPATAAPSGPIEYTKAKDFIGQEVTITAEIKDVMSFMPPATVLFLGAGMGQGGVGLSIADGTKWPVKPDTYKGKTVTVKGKLQKNAFTGDPEIPLNDPAQITIK